MEQNGSKPDLAQLRIDRSAWGGPAPGGRGRRRALTLAVVLAVLAGLGLLAWSLGWLTPAQEVRVAVVGRISPSQGVSVLNATGYVVAQRKAAVSSKGTGRLVYLGVEAGQRVSQGQVMAQLENGDLSAARDEVKARLAATRASAEQARAELNDAQANFKRFQSLLERKVAPRADYEVAETRLLKAKAALSLAERNIQAAEAGLRQAEATLDYTQIRAPFDAMVLTKDAEIGEVVAPFGSAVSAKAAVATLADMSSLMVEADVTEANIGKVRVDQPCLISLDALPDEPQLGLVHVIMPTADRSKGTIVVKVRFDRLLPAILPEMSAKVSFLARPLAEEERAPRLSVLKSALAERAGRRVAFKIEQGRARQAQVSTGAELGETVQVLDGLKDGDRVVASPAPGLKDGDKVRVVAE
jgi:RND family efflux transporter MFP subunit